MGIQHFETYFYLIRRNITNLSCAEFAHRVVKVKIYTMYLKLQ